MSMYLDRGEKFEISCAADQLEHNAVFIRKLLM